MIEQGKLPGGRSNRQEIERMIRVNHAGEYGAQRIYAGQLAVLGKSPLAPLLRHMAGQEQAHLDAFSKMMIERRVRPTALMPLWHVAGFLTGAATALMGEKAAMACTVAVESVIDEHYAKQIEVLGQEEAELKSAISAFRADEKEHHDTAIEQGAENAPFYQLLKTFVVYQTKVAIWLSTRV